MLNYKRFTFNYRHSVFYCISKYYFILKKYLCGNPDIAVTVNNSKKNDFYSYCQGLKIIARRKTLIDEVFVDMGDNLSNECVMQLMVTQHERFSEQKNK